MNANRKGMLPQNRIHRLGLMRLGNTSWSPRLHQPALYDFDEPDVCHGRGCQKSEVRRGQGDKSEKRGKRTQRDAQAYKNDRNRCNSQGQARAAPKRICRCPDNNTRVCVASGFVNSRAS